ncbi:MAG: hypothetical protein L3J83_10370 [Proteobacteria bacterium]|nr:hypothetical protein [Pseudomonadota bacterium]
MQVEVNNKDSIPLPLLGHVIFGTDEACDVILEMDTPAPEKMCSIINDKNACVLEVFNQQNITINGLPIRKMAILHPGDVIHVEDQTLKIINDNRLPHNCSIPFKLNNQQNNEQHLLTSVSGLRSFNKGNHGELTIVGDQKSFTHTPLSESDVPFSVSYINDNLTLLCKKGESIEINGYKAHYVILRNGDYISSGTAKFCVESPGTSSFSKYSPSHPRNIQLSEEYLQERTSTQNSSKDSFVKNNIWWITLLLGLAIIASIVFYLKNN